MKFILFIFILFKSFHALSSQDIIVWERNLDTPFFVENLQNIIDLTTPIYGELNLVPSSKMEQGRAFAELVKGNIDVYIAAPSLKKEQDANAVYVPLDRGLLGFRVCLTASDSNSLMGVSSPEDFISRGLKVGLGSHWPDNKIYMQNNFSVVSSPVYESLFAMLSRQRFDCFSRSINELENETTKIAKYNLKIDSSIIFIYPNADFIFVSPQNEELHKRISLGISLAIKNNSFFDIFDSHFEGALLKHGIYERKLIIMENEQVSPKALSAINEYGIASFLIPQSNLER